MKLLSQNIEKDKSGSISLVPQDKEDLWTLYNLIAKSDEITLKTTRNVKKTSSSTGTSSNIHSSSGAGTTRKVLTLTLRIEDVEFTPSDETMRLKGRTTKQHDDVPLSSYHTAEVELNNKFTLYKEDWDDVALNLINESCLVEEKAEVGAVVLEDGVAHLCLITDNMTVLKTKVEKSIPRKRRGDSSGHEKALTKFLEMTAESVIRNFKIDKLKAIVLVSPGFSAKLLYDKIFELATKEGNKQLIQAKSKFVVGHSSTGYLQGLEESLKSPAMKKLLSDTKFKRNVTMFDEFSKLLNDDDSKAWYGDKEVSKAVGIAGAVKVLMITDTLFKSDDIGQRKHYINLVDQVKSNGGEVVIFSSLHDSGEQLNMVTGLAVILNYPVYDLDESDDEQEE